MFCGLVHIWAENRQSEPAMARSTGASSVTDSTTTVLAPEVSV